MRNRILRPLKCLLGAGACIVILGTGLAIATSDAQGGKTRRPRIGATTPAANASPIFGLAIPPGYRDWQLISVNHLVTGSVDQLRVQLGNESAMKAFREGALPFPDGAIIAALHWDNVLSKSNGATLESKFPGAKSSVAGSLVNVQFMVKNSKKYAATGGWGFADFKDGKPASEEAHKACFSCHIPAKDHDFVFAHYAP